MVLWWRYSSDQYQINPAAGASTQSPLKFGVADSNFDNQTAVKTVEQSATTTFIGQGEVVTAVQDAATKIPESLIASGTTHCHQEIQQFLEKPVDIASNDISTASTGLLLTVNLPEDVISVPVYAQKLYGFQGIRGTIRLRLTLSANPFQQGRLILAFMPQGQVPGVNPKLRLLNLQTITQLPHVEIDIACQQEVDLCIPYTNPYGFYNLVTDQGHWGQAYLYVYSPLKVGSGGSNTVGYTLFASFEEDLMLVNPTLFTAPPGHLLERAKARKRTPTTKNVAAQRSTTLYANYQMILPKARRPIKSNKYQLVGRGQDPVQEEATKTATGGSISKALAGVTTVAKLASAVPGLNIVAAPVQWASSIAGGLASALGWSKPRFDCPFGMHITTNQSGFAANVDGQSSSMPLALSCLNRVQVLPGFAGSNVDEMSFSHLLPIPAWAQTINWATSATTGTILYSKSLAPKNWEISLLDGTVPYQTTYPLSLLARAFSFYRGTIRHRIKLVKTQYHKGKLLIVFLPGVTSAVPSLEDTAYLHRSIIDLTEGNEMEFEFPFTSPLAYLDNDTPYGQVIIMVVNELVAPSTCANNIDMLLEVSGSPDFEFMCPREAGLYPFIPSSVYAPMPREKEKEHRSELVASFQSAVKKTDTEKSAPCVVAPTMSVGCAEVDSPTLLPAVFCAGERMLSLLQLVKAQKYQTAFTAGVGTTPLPAARYWNVRPWATTVVTTDGANNVQMLGAMGDDLNWVQACFAYSRGGVRFGYNQTGEQQVASVAFGLVTSANLNPLININLGTYTEPGSRRIGVMSGVSALVEVPQYLQLHSRLNRMGAYGHLEPLDTYSPKVFLRVKQSAARTPDYLMRSAADDYQCGMFIGTPPVILIANLPAPAVESPLDAAPTHGLPSHLISSME